jgi:hypothetical protein|tara:strand:- start:471 stop:623 length:153 start_codon:yes stop_codon:yes gene_type:complete
MSIGERQVLEHLMHLMVSYRRMEDVVSGMEEAYGNRWVRFREKTLNGDMK